jgi:hypothetical protein
MTDEELTQRKRTLDLQLEANIALLRDSHRVQVQALERLWSATREESAGAVPEQKAAAPAPTPVKRRKHRAAGSLYDEVVSALDQIAGDFDKNDVCRLLATSPERSSLFRVLQKLEDERRIEAREFGSGRRSTIYRKTENG